MLNRRMVLVGALGVMLGALPFRSLSGQTAWSWSGRPSVEGFYTQYRFDTNGGSALTAEGVGGRLMWGAAPGAAPGGLMSRTELGLYGTYTPEQRFANGGLRFSTVGVGAVADVRPFASALVGRIDPFVSLGAGMLHTNLDRGISPAPSPLLDGSRNTFTLTPGVGARVRLTPNLAIQGDVRDAMTFRSDTRHNVAYGAGLRLTF